MSSPQTAKPYFIFAHLSSLHDTWGKEVKEFCAHENLWVDGMANIVVKRKTWSPGAKVPYHYKVPIHQYTSSEGLKPVLLSPCTTQCIDYVFDAM